MLLHKGCDKEARISIRNAKCVSQKNEYKYLSIYSYQHVAHTRFKSLEIGFNMDIRFARSHVIFVLSEAAAADQERM